MTTIRTTATVGTDGTVTIPVGTAEAGKRVDITVAPANRGERFVPLPSNEWWALFNSLAGSIDDPAFERPSQTFFEPMRTDE
jgi:hypothetical protein